METEPIVGLTAKLTNLPFKDLNYIIDKRQNFLKELKKVFKNAPGDTRRPINEVNLWDWSSIVAALYKSALAGAILSDVSSSKELPHPNKLKWQLLAVRFNQEQILGKNKGIKELIAKKEWLLDGLDAVQKLIEENYPIGNEVYRDEAGSIFVVPDIEDLLEIKDSEKQKTLKKMIIEELGYDGEISIIPEIDHRAWLAQHPEYLEKPALSEPPPIAEILSEKLYSTADVNTLKKWWGNIGNNTELCTTSFLRPQGTSREAKQQNISEYWLKKLKGRAQKWYKERNATIWIDEIADYNGRVCLLTGKLDVLPWLSPDGYINSLFITPANSDNGQGDTKTPSFARMRRVWETTKNFWIDIEQELPQKVDKIKHRIKITAESGQKNAANKLIDYNAYEAELDDANKTRFTVFYKDNNTIGEYMIIENLCRLAKKLGAEKKNCEKNNQVTEYIKEYLKNKKMKIYNSEGKNRETPLKTLTISQVEWDNTAYLPAIPILAEPSKFMALVPADKALDLVKKIKDKYLQEMGKVRNRLPLTLGMVYAKSHTPLNVLMDTGRRMLRLENKAEYWKLSHDPTSCDQDCILIFDNNITWRVAVKMGDKKTPDLWYPYFYVQGIPTNRSTAFKGPGGWLVHVHELKKGDLVEIYPSQFDFEFLSASAQRFEVTYNKDGKRQEPIKANRPYLIEQLDQFEYIWQVIRTNLSTSQIKHINGLIETKRIAWQISGENTVFEKFVYDIFCNAEWKNGIPAEINELIKSAVKGELRDILELYNTILKSGKGDE